MERTVLEEKIHSLLNQMPFIPQQVKEEIITSMPKYSNEDLADILTMLIKWDQELTTLYQTQSEQLSKTIEG
jgi:hypothetical protein